MKYHIYAIFSVLLLCCSCTDEELDRFAIDDVHLTITQTWEELYPHFEVKVINETGRKVDKVMLRLRYRDQTLQNHFGVNLYEEKDIELECKNGVCSYTAKDFPYAFVGDFYFAYAYAEVDGCIITSEKQSMKIPGNNEPDVTSATFVFSEISEENPYMGRGKIRIVGKYFSRYLRVVKDSDSRHWKGNYSLSIFPDSLIIDNCETDRYGKDEVTIEQIGKRYTINFDVPGLSIDSVDKSQAYYARRVTIKVSGMKPECTYTVSDATIESISDGEITFVPKHTWEYRQICLEETYNNHTMRCYSTDRIVVP